MSKKSKWFVVATEGATTDGRKIERQWLSEIAESYDPKTYGARINLEHFRWRYFDKDDAHSYSYGDVLAVKTEENAEGKLQLLAQIAPTDALVKLVQAKQKVYTSVEINTQFADTNKAYLVGLAVTDSPASLGTEYLTFCANATANPLNSHKLNPENLISEAVEAEIEFSEESPTLLEKFKAMFSKAKAEESEKFAEYEQALELLAAKVCELENENQQLHQELESLKAEFAQQAGNFAAQTAKIAEQLTELATQPSQNYQQRPTATGGNVDDNRFF